MKHQIGKILIMIAALAALMAQAELVATVDRNIISDADLLTLTVRASNATSDIEPNFSGLKNDFEIVSVSPQRNSSFSIINGNTTSISYIDYVIKLAPKRMGDLVIPPIQAGSKRTQAIPIRVQRLSSLEQQRMNRYVFFETTVDVEEVYVQEQIIYTVKLFYSEAIGGDFPQPPALPDTIVETLEDEKRYESIVNGKRYYVLEKRYALFPQRSGQLEIPRERFNGSRGRGSIFSRKESVSAVSEPHSILVKTIPNMFSGENWLPAKALSLKDSWKEALPTFRVGEPVNRSVTLSVAGLSSSTLPVLSEVNLKNAKVYSDPPTSENQVSEYGMSAIQVTTIGVVPLRPGELFLPEVRIPWWNTQTDQQEVAVLPQATFIVLPSTTDAIEIPTVTIPVTEINQPKPVIVGVSAHWQWFAILAGLLSLVSTWQWLTLRHQVRILVASSKPDERQVAFDAPDEEREYSALKTACISNSATDAHRQLFLWVTARFPGIKSVNELANKYDNLAIELQYLEMYLFSKAENTTWSGASLLEVIDSLRRQEVGTSKNQALFTSMNPS